MAKQTSKEKRKQRREEERRILAELDEAVAAERAEQAPEQGEKGEEPVLHCRRCRTVMEKGVCPVCGYKTYQPMSEEKRKRVRNILTVVCLVGFAILFFALKLWK